MLPTLRAHARVRFAAEGSGGIARHLEPDEQAVADDIGVAALRALVVVTDRREATRHRVVDHDRDDVRSVSKRAELRRIEKTRAGEVRLPPHDAIEFRRVAARLVNLQRDLRSAEDHVEFA